MLLRFPLSGFFVLNTGISGLVLLFSLLEGLYTL